MAAARWLLAHDDQLTPTATFAPGDCPQTPYRRSRLVQRDLSSATTARAWHQPCRFVQENQSNSKRAGTVRGFHFQRPPAAQAKLVSVLRGRILDVAVDIRRGSPSFGNYVSIELSAEGGEQLYIPTGFAHGFVTLEDDVVVTYKTSDYYAPSHEAGICWNDPDIGFPWPFKDADTIKSDKDGRLPRLKGPR